MSNVYTGTLRKMTTTLNPDDGSVCYHLPVGEHSVNLTELIGQSLTLNHTGNIYCSNCSKKTKKSYSQGHCYVCMKKLASCDMCMMKPETCHFDQGTCREPEWAEQVCMSDHYVYLSNTSSLKVGITRHTQIPTRWIDQGATQALPIFKVSNRKLSGLIEIELAKQIHLDEDLDRKSTVKHAQDTVSFPWDEAVEISPFPLIGRIAGMIPKRKTVENLQYYLDEKDLISNAIDVLKGANIYKLAPDFRKIMKKEVNEVKQRAAND